MPNVLNYNEQGGAKTVIGGEIDITGVLKLDSTEVTASAAELNKLDGAGAVVASGTEESVIADIANDANGTAIATAVNAIIDALQAFGIVAEE